MTMARKKKPARRKRSAKKLSKEERATRRRDRKFLTDIQTVFTNATFRQVPTRGTQLTIAGRQGDIDSFFVYENVLVLVEDTTLKEDVKAHIGKTSSFYAHIAEHPSEALRELSSKFPRFRAIRASRGFDDAEYRWAFVYCSLNTFDKKYESRHPELTFLRYPNLQYFLSLSKTIKGSVRFEIFRFLRLEMSEIGIQRPAQDKRDYTALVLPESPSGFPLGHKIVSFLVEPQTLLEQAYVLRRDGWEDSECLYQRLLVKAKIQEMREYLASEGRVFVNNIIATLPDDTRFLDGKGKQIAPDKLTPKKTIKVELLRNFGSIGLVDGQHRVFAYHEGKDRLDQDIELLREKQHLLVTGIVYPPGYDPLAKTQFEAKLFLEINDKQTRAKGDLKQAIQTIIEPFSDVAIAKRVVNDLAASGPLCGYLEEHFFDRGKIKTTSIVSYGMRHLVAIDGEESLFGVWTHPEKDKLKKRRKKPLLDEYVAFCSSHLSGFIGGFRQSLSQEMWVTNRKASRALTTTTINGLVFCLRRVIREGKTGDPASYFRAFQKHTVDFSPEKFTYHSSHWRDLGRELYEECFQ
ncbi:DGQHR domain-containing protein [Candidatus Bipolaricaulota bacterium]|nr:DGQHR domain-containing protein [Candidatus Bipolaricaulota bacterium]